MSRVHFDQQAPAAGVDPLFFGAAATPLDGDANLREGLLDESSDGMALAGLQQIVVRQAAWPAGLWIRQNFASGFLTENAPTEDSIEPDSA